MAQTLKKVDGVLPADLFSVKALNENPFLLEFIPLLSLSLMIH